MLAARKIAQLGEFIKSIEQRGMMLPSHLLQLSSSRWFYRCGSRMSRFGKSEDRLLEFASAVVHFSLRDVAQESSVG